jgi:hypothetical protein
MTREFKRRGRTARQHTLAGGWNQSGDHSKFTLPGPMFDAGPKGWFGWESGRGAPGSLVVGGESRLEVGGDHWLGVEDGGAR